MNKTKVRKNSIFLIIGLILGLLFSYIIFQVFQTAQFLGDLGECGMSDGPCYGQAFEPDLAQLTIDETINFEAGKFLFTNLNDTLPPRIIRIDKNDKPVWAYEFAPEEGCEIPHAKLSGLQLQKDEYNSFISFFNNSYGEGGMIYLDDNFDITYMCLKVM